MTDAINWSFLLAIGSAFGLLIDIKIQEIWKTTGLSLWIAIIVISGFSYYRIVKLYSKILLSERN